MVEWLVNGSGVLIFDRGRRARKCSKVSGYSYLHNYMNILRTIQLFYFKREDFKVFELYLKKVQF